jgi:hypothetical protein
MRGYIASSALPKDFAAFTISSKLRAVLGVDFILGQAVDRLASIRSMLWQASSISLPLPTSVWLSVPMLCAGVGGINNNLIIGRPIYSPSPSSRARVGVAQSLAGRIANLKNQTSVCWVVMIPGCRRHQGKRSIRTVNGWWHPP